MKTNKTYQDVLIFDAIGLEYLNKHSEKENKLCVSIRSVLKQVKTLIDDYNEKITENNLDNCAVDDKGIILKDEKGFLQFKPAGQKEVNKYRRNLLKELVEVHTRIRPENDALIKELTLDEIETFSDIVITRPKEE